MSIRGDIADAVVAALAERVAVWRPGSYAGGLYAAFDAATNAVALVPLTERRHVAERLHRLARKVGVLLPAVLEASCIELLAIVRTESTRDALEAAIAHQDSRGFRVVPSLDKATTFGVWTERPTVAVNEAGHLARQVEELDAALRWAHGHGRLRNFLIVPAVAIR